MSFGFKPTTPPTVEPLTLAEAKAHLRIEHGDDDGYISSLIIAARQLFEEQTGLAILSQSFVLALPSWPSCSVVTLFRPPLISVESVKYVDAAGTLQTVSQTDYIVDVISRPGTVRPAYGKSWPSVQSGHPNAVQISYTAGFGVAASSVPELIKHGIKFVVAHWYENRETVNIGNNVNELPFAVQSIINAVRPAVI